MLTPEAVAEKLIQKPVPHILVDSDKKMHGWWAGKRECTGERMLINPYNGCTLRCFFCYANALNWGYFGLFSRDNVVTVFDGYDRAVAKQLDSIDVASCGYLSPITDPFQPLEEHYHLSEKIIGEFVKRNIPVEFITKGKVPDTVFPLIAKQEHSFGQFTVLTPDESLRKRMVFGGSATTEELFASMKRMSSTINEKTGKGVHTVCRVDPIIPYVTSGRDMLRELLDMASEAGASHIIASCMDIPVSIKQKALRFLYRLNPDPDYPFEKLYCETIDGDLHAHISFRKKLFTFMRDEAGARGMTFSLCMEYEKSDPFEVEVTGGKRRTVRCVGLNREFMTSENCEGINIPIYVRNGDSTYLDGKGGARYSFVPASGCGGNCLTCKEPRCGVEELAMGRAVSTRKDFTYSDYRRWSKERALEEQKELKLF